MIVQTIINTMEIHNDFLFGPVSSDCPGVEDHCCESAKPLCVRVKQVTSKRCFFQSFECNYFNYNCNVSEMYHNTFFITLKLLSPK